MSRFLSPRAAALTPYTPGEQPQNSRFIKLNTNESPYPPSPAVAAAIADFDAGDLRRYPDPSAAEVKTAAARLNGLSPNQVFVGGGSDEVLVCAFMAFCAQGKAVYFPSITYGFYQVCADLFGINAVTVPLKDDFSVDINSYSPLSGPIFLANPNAPTGLCLPPADIEALLAQNPNRLLILDEAYADFAPGISCLSLLAQYDNLLIVRTASKSGGLAGLRLGFAYGHPDLIAGLERVRLSFNPYNLDRVSLSAALAALNDSDYIKATVAKITATRNRTAPALLQLGFQVIPSSTNFLMIRYPGLTGESLYTALRNRGFLVRYFPKPEIADYIRVSIGTDKEMSAFTAACEEIIRDIPVVC